MNIWHIAVKLGTAVQAIASWNETRKAINLERRQAKAENYRATIEDRNQPDNTRVREPWSTALGYNRRTRS